MAEFASMKHNVNICAVAGFSSSSQYVYFCSCGIVDYSGAAAFLQVAPKPKTSIYVGPDPAHTTRQPPESDVQTFQLFPTQKPD
jgi:hypothetical protein